MKKYIRAFLYLGFGFSLSVQAQGDHSQHAKHNMILFGEASAYYASHIVYKVPHNFQVILKIELSPVLKEKLVFERNAHPADEFIYLLNHMDISQIKSKPSIAGQIFRTDSDGTKTIIFEDVTLLPNEYSIIYFDEVPLNLQANTLPLNKFD